MAISSGFIQDLLSRCDVVDVVGQTVELKKAGANYQGLCPFHSEKTPSFSVSPSKQFYHCFGCSKSGDAIRFLMDSQGLSFVEAIQQLADHLGMVIPQEAQVEQTAIQRQAQRERTQQAHNLNGVLQQAAQYWRAQLKNSPQAQTYLQGRGLSDAISQRYGLGFATMGWRTLEAIFSDYQNPLLVQSGLVIERPSEVGSSSDEPKRYDRFRGRIMFPIRNVAGEYIGFGGRVLGQGEPKYLNSPETPVFSKGRELYGLFEARASLNRAGCVLVTEGYMDVVALAQHDFPNVVATLGTACTSEHVHKLFRFTEKIVFAFDGDQAGQNAARKALQVALPHALDQRSVYFLFLPVEHDPDSYIRALGRDAFARLVDAALPLSQMVLRVAREGCHLDTVEGRSRMATQAQPLWMALPDGISKRQILRAIAELVELGEHELIDLWGQALAKKRGRAPRPKSTAGLGSSDIVARGGQAFGGFEKRSQGVRISPSLNVNFNPRRAVRGRSAPASRVERALGILFSNSGFWDDLGMEDKTMLAHWVSPIGEYFAWLERQTLENGAQAWSVLRLELETQMGNEDYRLLLKAVEQAGLDKSAEQAELQDILARLRQDQRKERLQALAQEAMTDPKKYEEYKRLLSQATTTEAPKA